MPYFLSSLLTALLLIIGVGFVWALPLIASDLWTLTADRDDEEAE